MFCLLDESFKLTLLVQHSPDAARFLHCFSSPWIHHLALLSICVYPHEFIVSEKVKDTRFELVYNLVTSNLLCQSFDVAISFTNE